MLKHLYIIFFMLTVFCANTQGIKFFEGTWDEALAKAKSENKEIFVDIYTTWCGPCKKLDQTTFKDDSLGVLMNKHFVSIKAEAEHGPLRSIAYNYGIGGYPVMIFMDDNGVQKIQARGFKEANSLKGIAHYALNNLSADDKLSSLIESDVSDLSKENIEYLIEHIDEFYSSKKGQWFARYHNMLNEGERVERLYDYLHSFPFISSGLKTYYIDRYRVPNFFDERRDQIINDQYRVGRELEKEYDIAFSQKNKNLFLDALYRRMTFAVKTGQINQEERRILESGYIDEYDYKHKL